MPLGVLSFDNQAFFRVFPGAGLGRILSEGVDCILLLAPSSPEVFVESFRHELEYTLEWDALPRPDPRLGVWYSCSSVVGLGAVGHESWYTCRIRHVAGQQDWAYYRAYGCVVELLVHLSKVAAGVAGLDSSLVEALLSCVGRSMRGDPDRAFRLEMALRDILESVRSGQRR